MPKFAYKIIDKLGKEKEGNIVALDQGAAKKTLESKSYFIVSIQYISMNDAVKISRFSWRTPKLKAKELTLFSRQFASLIQISPLEEALRTISRQNEKPHVRNILGNVHKGVVEGRRLSEAMKREPKSFSALYRAMISAGESSGSLPMIVERLSDLQERQAQMNGKLISSLAYPIILALVALLVVVGLMVSVVPRVVEQFDDVQQQLPLITRIVIGISDFLASYWWMLLIGILVLGLVAWRALKDDNIRLRFDHILLRTPFVGNLLRNLHAARMARTLATMVLSRLPLVEGLALTSQTIYNRRLRQATDEIVEAVRGGSSLSSAFRNAAIFPPMLIYLVSSGEASGQLDIMLGRAADYLEMEFDNFTSTSLSLLEPIIIVIMGGLVAVIILSILLPILQLQNLTGL